MLLGPISFYTIARCPFARCYCESGKIWKNIYGDVLSLYKRLKYIVSYYTVAFEHAIVKQTMIIHQGNESHFNAFQLEGSSYALLVSGH